MSYSFASKKPPFSRVESIRINGEQLDPEKYYTMATTEFIAEGGDGYAWFKSDGIVLVSAENGKQIVPTIISHIQNTTKPIQLSIIHDRIIVTDL